MIRWLFPALLVTVLFLTVGCTADGGSDGERLDGLQARIDELEQRLDALEGSPRTAEGPPDPTTPAEQSGTKEVGSILFVIGLFAAIGGWGGHLKIGSTGFTIAGTAGFVLIVIGAFMYFG